MALALLAVVVYVVFCEITGTMPRCMLKWLTGFDCPGCGSQRALHALLDGDPLRAWGYNLLLPPLLIYALLTVALGFVNRPGARKLRATLTSPRAIYILFGVIMAWWIIRNIIPQPFQ